MKSVPEATKRKATQNLAAEIQVGRHCDKLYLK